MSRKPNYKFERQERERAKAEEKREDPDEGGTETARLLPLNAGLAPESD